MSVAEQTPPTTAKQRGRSEVGFIGAMSAYANGGLRDEAHEGYVAAADGVDVPTDFEGRFETVNGIANQVKEWRFDQLYMRFVAEHLGPTNVLSGVEMAGVEDWAPDRDLPVTEDPDLEIPEYYSTVNFHGGPWPSPEPKYRVRSPHIMPVWAVIARAGVAAVPIGSDVVAQREKVVAQARAENPEKILDMGSGGNGAFMGKIYERYPHAEIHGVDLSAQLLSGAAGTAKALGTQFQLSHQNAEHTNYPDNTFDLVTSYALVHELPAPVTENVLAEAFRVLKPGGELVFGDVPPYRAIPDFQFLVYDWETEGRVEPYWREECLLNRGDVCRQIGFEAVEEYGIGPTEYPWVLLARKPLE